MPNIENLRPGEYQLTRENKSNGGKASGETRRRRRDIRLALEALLEKNYFDKSGKSLSGAEAIAVKQMEKALKGDTKAFEVVRDTAGQKPVEKVMLAEVDQSVIDEVERAVLGDGTDETASD